MSKATSNGVPVYQPKSRGIPWLSLAVLLVVGVVIADVVKPRPKARR